MDVDLRTAPRQWAYSRAGLAEAWSRLFGQVVGSRAVPVARSATGHSLLLEIGPDIDASAWPVPPQEHNSRSAALPPEGESGPRLFFQRVPEGKTAKNRLHLDVRAAPGSVGDERVAALDAEATRLADLGATRVRRVDPDGRMETGFVVMQDPEGNEFCLD